jgi:hypothetical protein
MTRSGNVGGDESSARRHQRREGRQAAAVWMTAGIMLWVAITATITSRIIVQEGMSLASVSTRLRGVMQLHADGILTDEEYAAKKAELLERL